MDNLLSTTVQDVSRLCVANSYDYIIIGSGMGGGILARTLLCSNDDVRVLLIERGRSGFSTHVLNAPSPRWNHNDPHGPSMDNYMVYTVVKSPILTATSRSHPYVGGPVYCLGGRSNLWGLYTPPMEKDYVRRHYPSSVYSYLFEKGPTGVSGYDRAYKWLSGDPHASLTQPYPDDGSVSVEGLKHPREVLAALNNIADFSFCPMAAQFAPREPEKQMYQMPMGGFSAVSWILDRVYNKNEHLHVLPQTQVLTVNNSPKKPRQSCGAVRSLTVRDNSKVEHEISTGNATVILSAGTIDTATIALRSGLCNNNLVGRGLTDHDIWGTRLEYETSDKNLSALRVQSWVSLEAGDKESSKCLLNVTINAQSFLGHSQEREFPVLYTNKAGVIVTEAEFSDTKKGMREHQVSTIQIVFIFAAELENGNRVFNLPEPVPTVEITSRPDNSKFVPAMQNLARKIKEQLEDVLNFPCAEKVCPELSRAGFGVVAHEVGTMRMKGNTDGEGSVVDENLKVHGWENLYVCDLSVLPASPAANPSLTLAALAQRLGDHLESKRRHLHTG